MLSSFAMFVGRRGKSVIFFKRVPFLSQMADSDCGAACLAMISSFYGHRISVYSARCLSEKFGPPQSTSSLIKAAREIGLKANLVSADLDALHGVQLPAILFWNFSHFVILEKIKKKGYLITDPSFGRRFVSASDFNLSYTGILVQLAPGDSFQPGFSEKNALFRDHLVRTIKNPQVLGRIAVVTAFSLLAQLTSLVPPMATKYIVDEVFPGASHERLNSVLVLIALFAPTLAIMAYVRSIALVYVRYFFDKALLTGYFEKTLSLPIRYFNDRSTPELVSRMNSNSVLRDALSNQTSSIFMDGLFICGYFAVLMVGAPLLAFAVVLLGLLHVLVSRLWIEEVRDLQTAEIRGQSSLGEFASEAFNGISSVKSAGGFEALREKWNIRIENFVRASVVRGRTESRSDALSLALKVCGPMLLFWLSSYFYLEGKMSLGEVFAYSSIALMALVPFSSIVAGFRQIKLVRTHIERIGEAWLHVPERVGGRLCPDLGESGTISFNNVAFRYAESGIDCLSSVNVDIPLGKKIGVVGPSGSGKSTFASLLMGHLSPTSGDISVNGVSMNEISLQSLRQQIAHVVQSPFLFNGTIKENVLFGTNGVGLADVEEACMACHLTHEISNLPMKYETRIGEFGVKLSGGQKQRITIARALIRKARMLVLDEATSNIDSLLEASISDRLRKITGTQVIISHRVSTIQHCDLILVIRSGTIESCGTFDEVMSSSAYFRSCIDMQAGVGVAVS